MYLEIVSPEATLFNGEVTSVNGEFEMLNNHAPIVSILKEGFVKISGSIELEDAVKNKFTKNDKGVTLLKINSGTLELKNNKLIVLAD